MVGPAAKRDAVSYAETQFELSERRACRLLSLSRTGKRHKRKRVDDPLLIERIKELATRRSRWGYRQLHRLATREGLQMNQKKFRRIYREQKLSIKLRKKSRLRTQVRVPMPPPKTVNERWSMDFVSDQLGPSGRRFRVLTVIDEFTRENVALFADFSIPGLRVTRVLDEIRETPKDNCHR